MNETTKRLISGFSIGGLYGITIMVDGFYAIPIFLVTLFFTITGMHEFFTMATRSNENKPSYKTGMFFGVILTIMFYLERLRRMEDSTFSAELQAFLKFFHLNFGLIGFLIILLILTSFLFQLLKGKIEGTVYSIATTILGVAYVSFAAGHLLLLHSLKHGVFYIWMVSFSTFMSDTAAYFSGRAFGKHKVGLAASPNKTWEGYIGAIVGEVLLTLGFYFTAKSFFTVPEMSVIEIIAFGVVIAFVSILGDLIESMIKRDSGVKDSSAIVWGHGGILDVIDALLLTIPCAYYFYSFIAYLKNF